MRFYKSETLTVCTKRFLRDRLDFFDKSIATDPTLITEENKVLRRYLGHIARKRLCFLCFLCFYNSTELIARAKVVTDSRNS